MTESEVIGSSEIPPGVLDSARYVVEGSVREVGDLVRIVTSYR